MPKITKSNEYQSPIHREKKSFLQKITSFFGGGLSKIAQSSEGPKTVMTSYGKVASNRLNSLDKQDLVNGLNKYDSIEKKEGCNPPVNIISSILSDAGFPTKVIEQMSKNKVVKDLCESWALKISASNGDRSLGVSFLNKINWNTLFDETRMNILFVGEVITPYKIEVLSEFLSSSLESLNRIKNENKMTDQSSEDFIIDTANKAIKLISSIRAKNLTITPSNLFAIALNKAADKIPPIETREQNTNPEASMPHLSKLYSGGDIDVIHGTNRDVYLDRKNNVGYKVYIPTNRLNVMFLDSSDDMRLNDIYGNKSFYGGKYAKYANVKTINIVDDVYAETPEVQQGVQFSIVIDAIPLSGSDKIPLEWIKQLNALGFKSSDIKPQNFVYVKSDNGKYDLLPIDGKFIGLSQENKAFQRGMNMTRRTGQIENSAKKTKKGGYEPIGEPTAGLSEEELTKENAEKEEYKRVDKNEGLYIGLNNKVNMMG